MRNSGKTKSSIPRVVELLMMVRGKAIPSGCPRQMMPSRTSAMSSAPALSFSQRITLSWKR